VARVLEPLKPLVALIGQAEDPVATAQRLADTADCTTGPALVALLVGAVTDKRLAEGVLRHAGVIGDGASLLPEAAVRLAQAQALVEALHENQCDLVMTIPPFLRAALADLVRERPAVPRPRETAGTLVALAREARERLVIAAPFLHRDMVESLAPHVSRVLAAGGEAVVITRALAPVTGKPSQANRDAVAVLRRAAGRHEERLLVRSWEQQGLGVHCKVVLADQACAYLGSANMTPQGAHAQAEIGVMLRGPQVRMLSLWLDQVGAVLADRVSAISGQRAFTVGASGGAPPGRP
jgi:phosphatidylserine/phosphatidylglycerophosphate/cardiolipin synthase-like enzyme